MLLKGKRVIVTGGVTGIGKATVIACVREGAAVVSLSRAKPTEERVVKTLEVAKKVGPGPVTHIKCDVCNQDEVNSAFEKAVAFLGGLDALVNCHGLEQQKPAEDLTAQDLLDMFNVHVVGTVFTCKAAFRYMKNKGGSIINYGSNAGVQGTPNMAGYSTAKGAVIAFSRTIAQEWAKYGIRTNIVCPAVWTEMAFQWFKEMSKEAQERTKAWFASVIPLGGDMGQPEDAANLNVFLASDMSRFINGQTIAVDGGLLMTR